VKEPDSAPKTFTDADLDAFLAILTGVRFSVWAMATVMRNTGLRISEAYLLKKENLVVDPEMGAYLRFFGKGARERLVPLNEEALAAVKIWVTRIKKPSIYTVRRAFIKAAEVSGVHLTPHNFRSSLGTKLANAGHSYDSIADLFGQKICESCCWQPQKVGHMIYQTRPLLPNTYNQDLEEFIKANGDKRITQKAFDYMCRPDRHGLAILAFDDQYIVGISGSTLLADESITVTHKEYRNKGIGTFLMGQKIDAIGREYFMAVVAEDNLPSRRICLKNDLKETGNFMRTRTTGDFKAFVYRG
jgi:hypothetical protein